MKWNRYEISQIKAEIKTSSWKSIITKEFISLLQRFSKIYVLHSYCQTHYLLIHSINGTDCNTCVFRNL